MNSSKLSVMDIAVASRRSAYLAFAWVVVFVAWHVVWYLTGLGIPAPSDRNGPARVAVALFQVVVIVMATVGTVLPLAFAMSWGRRLPRWLVVVLGWIGFAVLAVRAMAGVVDTLLRVAGRAIGLTGPDRQRGHGVENPGAWDWIASYTTDALFVAGAVAFGVATRRFQRVTRFSAHIGVQPAGVKQRSRSARGNDLPQHHPAAHAPTPRRVP
ncbi:hypothetical protein [Micromonospora sp. WMMD812]|uniref:hypothetical protein n=1 Tax=Micromonospora sp. WMMD812 TaxID=3015152 RepID=UPI00248BB062|nr:hypothetical protein [Micromonospora sp. WMMD812]WBB65217.1 hypothetical protein O7603_18570 [Micromonospora sp. WMMD812]